MTNPGLAKPGYIYPALAFLFCITTTAQAWEYTPGLPCILSHSEGDTEIELTYDPTKPLYSVTVRKSDPWVGANTFAMRFSGPRGLAISTDRHNLSGDGRSVTVEDTGFGNVLDGLQFNDTVTALLGDAAVSFQLAGAAGPVAAFRLCRPTPGA